jgi:hypothetical protein
MWSKSKLELDPPYGRVADSEDQFQVTVFLFKPLVGIDLHRLNFALRFVHYPKVFFPDAHKLKFRDQNIVD